jgi:hypothetical protein
MHYLINFHEYQIKHLHDHYHKIPLTYGSTTNNDMDSFLQRIVTTGDNLILVKGGEKVQYLQNLMPSATANLKMIHDLGDIGCPNIAQLNSVYGRYCSQTSCILHSIDERLCSGYKARLFTMWMEENQQSMFTEIDKQRRRQHR